jgi:hypothetical protein
MASALVRQERSEMNNYGFIDTLDAWRDLLDAAAP